MKIFRIHWKAFPELVLLYYDNWGIDYIFLKKLLSGYQVRNYCELAESSKLPSQCSSSFSLSGFTI